MKRYERLPPHLEKHIDNILGPLNDGMRYGNWPSSPPTSAACLKYVEQLTDDELEELFKQAKRDGF